jgi:hypothetical protein
MRARRNSQAPACRLNEALDNILFSDAQMWQFTWEDLPIVDTARSGVLSGPLSVLTAPFRCGDWGPMPCSPTRSRCTPHRKIHPIGHLPRALGTVGA